MLNIRTLILSVALVVVLMLTAQLVTARTAVASNPSGDSASLSDNQASSANPTYVSSIRSYQSSLGECFDLPLREAAECRGASQTIIHSHRSPLDECFDVSIPEIASCHEASQALTP